MRARVFTGESQSFSPLCTKGAGGAPPRKSKLKGANRRLGARLLTGRYQDYELLPDWEAAATTPVKPSTVNRQHLLNHQPSTLNTS